MEHCERSSASGNTCQRFAARVPLACEIFQSDNVRSEDQDYVVEQYPACMQTCKKTTKDRLFCREFSESTTEICRAFYSVE